MKRLTLYGLVLAIIGGGVFFYFQYGGNPDVRRERHLKKAREYIQESKLNEATVELKNAVKVDPRSVEARLELAHVLTKRGDLRAAYGELVRALDLKPDSTLARYRIALFELGVGNLKSAKEHYEKIRAVERDAVQTRSLGARIALAEKLPAKAINELEEILKNNPRHATVYTDLGLVQLSIKDFKSAEKNLRKALELDPKAANARVALSQLYLASGNQEKGEEELLLGSKEDPENEALLHVLGLFYSLTRKADDFEKLYLGLLKKKPDSLMVKKRLAEFYLARGQNKQARIYTNDILKKQPGDIDGHFFQGRLNLGENLPQKAIEDLTIVTKGAPRLGPGFYFLGLAQRAVNRKDDATKNLTKAIELNPNWVLPRVAIAQMYAGSGNPDLALEQSDTLLRALPKNETLLLLSGAARLRKGEIDRALVIFNKVLEINPKSFPAHMNKAAILALQRKYPDAIKNYDAALRLEPQRNEPLSAIVQLLLVQGEGKRALDRANAHLAKTKSPAEVHQLLGQINLSLKDYSNAIEHLAKAIDLNQNLVSAYLLLGNAYTAQRKNDSAIEQYEKVLSKNPKSVPALMMVGLIHDRVRQTKKANEYYQKVLDINKMHALAANNLAYNYAQDGGNLDVALGIAQKAREANPNDPNLADTLGWIYYKKGTFLSAIALLKESNDQFKGSNPEVLYHLGMAYLKTGDKVLAAENLKKALTLEKPFNGRDEVKKVLEDLTPKRT